MPISKTTGKESVHASTRRGAKKMSAPDVESVARFAETMKLRSLAPATQAEYLRFVRKLAARHGGDPAGLDEDWLDRERKVVCQKSRPDVFGLAWGLAAPR
jgi:hypothetical protein